MDNWAPWAGKRMIPGCPSNYNLAKNIVLTSCNDRRWGRFSYANTAETSLQTALEALSDNALMIAVRDGDVGRLGLLFERYKRPLYGFFYGMNRSQELSEDLVQNTFLRILKYRHLFRGDGDFRTWMFHIARNVSHDHFRKDKLKWKESVDDWQNKLSHDDNKEGEMELGEKNAMLVLAMDRLPEKAYGRSRRSDIKA